MDGDDCRKLAILALENMRGDDLARCRRAFQTFSCREMQEMHGQSGKTRAEVLAGYEVHDARISEAIKWIKDKKKG